METTRIDNRSPSWLWLRVAGATFLVIELVVAIALCAFAFYMEGMRHSQPGPSEVDWYYVEACLPVALIAFWLVTSLLRVRWLARTISAATGFGAMAVLLIATEKVEGVGVAAATAAFFIPSFVVWWALVREGPNRRDEEGSPNQTPDRTRLARPEISGNPPRA